ncbi:MULTISPECIES: hypothetical protein [Rhizobium]|jgi:hypothetical protein|uniref:hypothetical protein n=1 Tax=Rhizobium TaxID=379 RepID=UPI0005230248|nr:MULTISPECIES: hypothetical protein [Rhizobium]KPN28795.1 hypothetical protein KS05_00225 [Rhizobium brockwellii]QJX07126.1 hypothetical protein RLCC275e_20005 [Rhizobium brockwellii]TAX41207.1 hypothetical protein ELI05_20515 [Rhizobium leguminosarum]TAX94107.1 hypothetical protein ELH97_20085 [Rhizobium leguminosarum]TAX98645.1 hypothetical protein ELH94_20015 [Rhizobium leguminosarum]
MTSADHQSGESIVQAAQWLIHQNPVPQPIIPIIRERFGLSALEACEAAALSNKYRILRRANG